MRVDWRGVGGVGGDTGAMLKIMTSLVQSINETKVTKEKEDDFSIREQLVVGEPGPWQKRVEMKPTQI